MKPAVAYPRGIRIADLGDIAPICAMAREFHDESDLAHMPFDLDRTRKAVGQFVGGDTKLALVDDAYKGFFLGRLDHYIFCGEPFAAEDYWYVRKAHRGHGMTGIKLLQAFLDWGAAMGAKDYFCGISTGIKTEQADRLMTRLGFRRVGANYRSAVNGHVR